MGWQDRDYNRQGGGGTGTGFFYWLVAGSLPLFRVFGISVRMHSTMLITIVLGLLLGIGPGLTVRDRLESMLALFVIVLLHEFGHCFGARWVGGEANQIVMHPLGGLALCAPPHRPLPTFITVAAGPAVNVIICLICGTILFSLSGWLPWNPFQFRPSFDIFKWATAWSYVYWIYQMSFMLLAFNLLPIFPLDGGQMLQAILWPKMGFYKSMRLSTEVGMAGSVVGALFALLTGNVGLIVLAAMGFLTCRALRMQLMESGPDFMQDVSYAVGPDPKPKKKSWVKRWKAERAEKAEAYEQQEVDRILAKVAEQGMASLSSGEKRTLSQATANQQKRDAQRARRR